MESLNVLHREVESIVAANLELRPSLQLLRRAASELLECLSVIDGFQNRCAPRLDDLVLNLLEGHLPTLLTMARPTAAESSDAHPLLATLIERSLMRWRKTQTEIFTAVMTDWTALEQNFGSLKRFVSIAAPSGDFHRGGRSVRVLHFENGKKIVFKPRSMRIDQAFQNFLRWAGSKGLEPSLLRLNVLDRGSYGWTEFVEVRACETESQTHLFDARVGALLALLHVVGATDVHFQNILAAGEHPVVIDLETLFHRFPRHTEDDAQSANGTVYLEVLNSVTSVGLLSWPLPVGPETWLDMGGLGGRFHPPGLMKRVESNNRPFLNHQVAPVHLRSVSEGYRAAYEMLVDHKLELLSSNGPLAEFRGTRVRVVIQGTYVYQQTLIRSYGSESLRDEDSRRQYFTTGFQYGPPGVQQFAPSEIAQLMNGDVPYFDIEVDGDELQGADGSRFKNVAGQNGWSTAMERVNKLSKNDFDKQSWFIQASYGFSSGSQSLPIKATDLPGVTIEIAEKLASLAVVKSDSASWLSFGRVSNADDEPLFTVDAMKRDFVFGLSGLAIFFQSLAPRDLRWQELEQQITKSIAEPRSPQSAPLSAEELGAELFATARSSRPSRSVFDGLRTALETKPALSPSVLLGLHAAAKIWPEANDIARKLMDQRLEQNDLRLGAAGLAFNDDRLAKRIVPRAQTTPSLALAQILIATQNRDAAWESAARESVHSILAKDYSNNLALIDGQAGALILARVAAKFLDLNPIVPEQERQLLEAIRKTGFVSERGERTHSLGLGYGLAGLGFATAVSGADFDPWPLLLLS